MKPNHHENHLNHHHPLRALPGSFAQFEVPVPYNPDGNADGFIALPDLLDFLMLYGSEYRLKLWPQIRAVPSSTWGKETTSIAPVGAQDSRGIGR